MVDCIRDIKDTVAVTLATDDDKQLKAHNKSVMLSLKMMSLMRTIKH
jgi:hypothetical protein